MNLVLDRRTMQSLKDFYVTPASLKTLRK